MISKLEQYRLKKMEIEKLKSENRYYDICEKYPLSCNYKKMMNFESIRETGKKYNSFNFKIRNLFIYKDIKNIKYKLKKAVIYGPITAIALIFSASISFEKNIENSYEINKKVIDEYDEDLEEYASKFDSNNMDDFEIIMTVMNYIRSNTQYGFDYEVDEITNYSRLVLNDQNNIGVCRHMTDKFTTIMNFINPDYEAHNLYVDLNSNCDTLVTCNVEQPLSQKFIEDAANGENNIEQSNFVNKNIGDHVVSILKPTGENYYLVVDVTNPSIGVLKDGKIYMFNSNDYSFIEYRPVVQFIMNINNSYADVNKDFILSNFQNVDLDKLNKMYGLEMQNKVLEKIKNKN